MKMTKTMRPLKLGLVAPLALTCLSLAPHARADTVLLAQTTLVSGTNSTVDSFTATQKGTVTVSMKGLDWAPTTLSALSFSATSASDVLASWNGTGMTSNTLTFDVGPGTYFAHIMATAGGALDLGLYSMVMTFNPNVGPPPMPLPASGWMLLIGMFALMGLARVIRPVEMTGAVAA